MRKPPEKKNAPTGKVEAVKAHKKSNRDAANFCIRGAVIKQAIVRLAVWGLIPAAIAIWLLSLLRLREV